VLYFYKIKFVKLIEIVVFCLHARLASGTLYIVLMVWKAARYRGFAV